MNIKPQNQLFIGFLLISLLFSINMFGATVTWNGSAGSAWGNASNWTGGLPNSGVDVLIPANPTNGVFPVISTEAASARKITINTGASFTMIGGTLDIYGDWTNDGSYASNAGIVTFRGTGKAISGAGTNSFATLIIANGASITMSSNASCSSFHIAAGSSATSFNQSGLACLTVNGNTTVAQPTANTTNVWNIASGSANVAGDISIGGSNSFSNRIAQVKMTTGTLNAQGNIIFNSPAGLNNAILDMSGGASNVNLSGNIVMTNASGKIVSGSTSQISFIGSAPQTLIMGSALVYNNIVSNNTHSAGLTLGAAITTSNVLGNLIIQAGSFSNGGFSINGNSSKSFTLSNNATFRAIGTSAFVSGFGTKSFGTNSTVSFEGANQIIAAESYGNLTLAGSGTKTMSGNAVVNGNFVVNGTTSVSASSGLVANGNFTINAGAAFAADACMMSVKGAFTNNGTFNAGTSTLVFAGVSAQTISGSTTFKNVTVNNANGLTLNNDIAINGNLLFTTGKITTGAKVVYITSSGSITGASANGYVLGNLKKDLTAATATIGFEVGDATVFAPLNFTALSVASAGTVSVSTSAGDNTNISTSSFIANRTVNRKWLVSSTNASINNGMVTAQFANTDCDAGINTAFNEIAIWSGTAWIYPTAGTRTTTSTQAMGINTFGNIQIGERFPTPVLSSISPATGNRLQTMNVTFSGANFAAGISTVNVGAGITLNSVTVNSSSSITANITIAAEAATGNHNFTVSTPAGVTSASAVFNISNPIPVLTQTSAAVMNRYETANVVLNGSNFINGVSTVNFGNGVVVNSASVLNANTIHANISIASNAIAGTRTITVTNAAPAGGVSNALTFGVTAVKIFSLTNGDWNNAASWLPASAPTSGESISIPANAVCVIPAGVVATVDSMNLNGHLTIENGASLVCAGKFTQAASGYLNVAGDMPTCTSSAFNGVTEFSGASNQNIPANMILHDVMVTGAGMKTIAGSISMHDLTVDGSLEVAPGASEVKISGNLTVNGSFNTASSKVVMNGAAAQSITGTSIAFNDLSISNASTAGVTVAMDAMLKGVLTLGNNAKLVTTGFPLVLASDANGTASIAAVPPSASIQGEIVMERYIAANSGFSMLGSAVNVPSLQEINDDFEIHGVTGSNCSTCPANMWFYNESAPGNMNNEYVVPSSLTNTMSNGRGIFMKRNTSAEMTIDMQGNANIGNINFPVTYTQSTPPRPNDDGWFLASNPYPAVIDWESAGWTKTNISSTIYTWDPTVSDYRAYQAGMGGSGSRFIPSSAAFWVKATGSNPVLSSTEQVKATGSNASMRINTNSSDVVTLRVQMASQVDLADEAYIRFRAGSASTFEPEFDSHRLHSATSIIPNIATVSLDSALLSINTLGELDHNLAIPVVVRVNTTGSYIISAPSLDQFPQSACIILDDLQTGVKTNLRDQNYTVTLNATTSSSARFMLRIAPPIKVTATNASCAGANDGKIVAKGQSNGPWSYVWKNASGQVIRTAPSVMAADSIENVKPGTYTVTITNAMGYCSIITEEASIIEPIAIDGQPIVSDITCHGKGDGQIRLVPVGGTAPYEFHWENGANAQQLEHIGPGTYKVMITDQNQCVNFHVIEVHEPAALTATMQVRNIDFCNTEKGMIEAHIEGGIAPYTYMWSNMESEARLADLNEGAYSVKVIDANGCSLEQHAEISKASTLHAEFAVNADTVFLSNGAKVQFANRSEGVNEYHWSFGDGATSVDANPIHEYQEAGNYEVKLTAGSSACQEQFTMQVMVLRNRHDELGKMNIWPNPNPGDKVNVELDGAYGQEIRFILYSLNGTRLMEKSITKNASNFELDFVADGGAQLQAGSYLLTALVGGKSVSSKLVVKR